MQNYYYGLTSEQSGIEAIQCACSLLPNREARYVLMLATAKAESGFGRYRDMTHQSAGEGWFQFDPGNIADVRDRMNRKYKEIVNEAYEKFDVYIEDIDYAVLRQAPLSSAVMAAFKYWLVPHELPNPTHFEGVWLYYKVWYNSRYGKATIEKFRKAYNWAMETVEKYPIVVN